MLCHGWFPEKLPQLARYDATIRKDQLMAGGERDQPHVRAAGNAPAHVVNWSDMVVRSLWGIRTFPDSVGVLGDTERPQPQPGRN